MILAPEELIRAPLEGGTGDRRPHAPVAFRHGASDVNIFVARK